VLRNALAVIFGLIACNLVFGAFAYGTVLIWPDYAIHGHQWLDQRIFTFPPIMAYLNLAYWAASFFVAGWATAKIARDGSSVSVAAGLMALYAIYVHMLHEWSKFPWWYNLAVVISVVPAILWGARIATEQKG
jgi:hypothetical protein